MTAFVSRRNCLLVLSRRAWVRPFLLAFAFVPLLPQLTQISVGFGGVAAVNASKAAGVIGYPILRASSENKAGTLALYGQPVAGADAQLAKQVGGQGYLVLAADGAHGFFAFARRGKIRGRGLSNTDAFAWP